MDELGLIRPLVILDLAIASRHLLSTWNMFLIIPRDRSRYCKSSLQWSLLRINRDCPYFPETTLSLPPLETLTKELYARRLLLNVFKVFQNWNGSLDLRSPCSIKEHWYDFSSFKFSYLSDGGWDQMTCRMTSYMIINDANHSTVHAYVRRQSCSLDKSQASVNYFLWQLKWHSLSWPVVSELKTDQWTKKTIAETESHSQKNTMKFALRSQILYIWKRLPTNHFWKWIPSKTSSKTSLTTWQTRT